MTRIPRISSALRAVNLRQEPPPLIIGERLNTQGSRKAKEMVLKDDFDGLVRLAATQVEDGAHCLDVCVATTERSDELEFMSKLVKRVSNEIDAPLVIDSTDPLVIESVLKLIPGKPIINSINLEGDGSRFHHLAPLMYKYGVPAIAMCIGPNGMAKTAEEKLKTAQLLLQTGERYNLKPWQFIFDVLTFTLATGETEFQDSAKATINGIRLVKETLTDSFTVLGLSNVSFGLPVLARRIVNSVFLYYAIKAGLDAVIINAKDIIPYSDITTNEKNLAENLIFNTHQNALSELISYFQEGKSLSKSSVIRNKIQVDPNWDASKRCYYRIVNRLSDGIKSDVVTAIYDHTKGATRLNQVESDTVKDGLIIDGSRQVIHDAAVTTLNEVLLPAMKEVGDKFGSGELILPFVLKSAECMKAAVAELEKYLIKKEGVSKGKLVLCTVYGDVHDIGKNLVKTILSNNGYTVYDLGKQVPIQRIVESMNQFQTDAVGLSALLVSTSKQMQYLVEHFRQNNITIPILCGGAAINSSYINRVAKEGGIYEPGVFYCKTAFDGLRVMNNLMSNEKEKFISEWREKLVSWNETKVLKVPLSDYRKAITPVQPPVSPHINQRIRLEPNHIDLEDIWKFVNKKSLFVLSWGIRGKSASGLQKEAEQLLAEWKERVITESLFQPRAVYGYFKCHNINDKLTVDLPTGSEQVTFDFPRSSRDKHLCLTDYFGRNDLVAFQAVTVGSKVQDVIDEWNNNDKYTDAFYLHGLAVETAEALAEWVNSRIKDELGIGPKRGLRYSWGYPSCPDISQHHLVWKILDASRSGMSLTDAGQIIPDQSTAAIVVHHPDAEYFTL
ncbi:MAG: dihydropteroate synthase [Nitrososphaeraceae archaeon]